MLPVVGPEVRGEGGLPARYGDVAEVSRAQDHPRAGQDQADQPQEPDVVVHLVDDAGFARGRQCGESIRVLAGHRLRHGPVQVLEGLDRRGLRAADQLGKALKTWCRSGSSPAPQTAGCEASICSTRVVPDRGRPTMNTGRAWRSPEVSRRVESSGRKRRDHAVDEPRLMAGVVDLPARGSPGRLDLVGSVEERRGFGVESAAIAHRRQAEMQTRERIAGRWGSSISRSMLRSSDSASRPFRLTASRQ